MPVFDSLQRASFDGLDFPVRAVHIRGRYRVHTHEYLRVPGGVNEKLERGLYRIEMEAEFHATIRGYGQLWPNVLAAIRGKFEQGITGPLVIPTIGTVPAMIEEWDQTADMGRVRSGESVRIPFLEDQTELFLSTALAKVDQSSIASSASNLQSIRDQLGIDPADTSLFDAIQDAANAVIAFKDQADLFGGLMSAKIAQLTGLLGEADRAASTLKNPENHQLLEALHELWDAAVTLGRNLAESPRGPRVYVVPRTMSVADIAAAIYGSTDRATEIMLNNALDDAFAVRAGTRIIYFTG